METLLPKNSKPSKRIRIRRRRRRRRTNMKFKTTKRLIVNKNIKFYNIIFTFVKLRLSFLFFSPFLSTATPIHQRRRRRKRRRRRRIRKSTIRKRRDRKRFSSNKRLTNFFTIIFSKIFFKNKRWRWVFCLLSFCFLVCWVDQIIFCLLECSLERKRKMKKIEKERKTKEERKMKEKK